jgi:hypothetical protein
MHAEFWCRSLRERDYLEKLGIDVRLLTDGLVGYGLDSFGLRWCQLMGGT